MRGAQTCPDEARLVAFVDGAAHASASAPVEAHLDVCPGCRTVVGELLRHSASEGPSSDEEISPTTKVAGRYEVEELLGSGGMGRVYAAHDSRLERRVALKVLRRVAKAGGEVQSLLLREAQALARVSHPNVLQVYDLTTVGEDVFIAMELVQGVDLAAWLKLREHTTTEILQKFSAAGEGLAAVHSAGLVHCDFKPANVLVGEDGRVRISDFGLASLSDAKGAAFTGGTLPYLAPERVRGQRGDARADQFSFFAALYDALCGAGASTPRSPKHPRLPLRLRPAFARGLAADPAQRYPGMRDALLELSRPLWRPRHPLRVAAVVALLLMTVGATWTWKQARERACGLRAGRIHNVWNPEKKRVLRSAFELAAGAPGGRTFVAVERAIDAFSRSWVHAEQEACVEEGRRQDSPRADCLEQRLTELGALLALFEAPDRTLAFEAPRAAQSLIHPGTCAAALTLQHDPNDPRLPKLRVMKAQLKALHAAGRQQEALALAPQAVSLAEGLRLGADHAELLLFRGQVLQERMEYAASEAPLFEAILVAQQTGHEAVAAKAWLVLGGRARALGRMDEADRAARMAESLAVRKKDARLELEAQISRLLAALERGDFSPQQEPHRQPEALAAKLGDGEDEQTLRLRRSLAHGFFLAGRYEESLRLDTQVLEVRRRQFGDEHPEIARFHSALSGSLGMLGRHEEAVTHAQRADGLFKTTLGERAPGRVDTLNNIASGYSALARYPDAFAPLQEAVSLSKAVLGADHPKTVRLLTNLGLLLARSNDPRGAIQRYQEALAALDRTRRRQHPDAITTLSQLANAKRMLGQLGAAKLAAEEAVKLHEQLNPPLHRYRKAFIALGAVLLELGQPQRALPILLKAESPNDDAAGTGTGTGHVRGQDPHELPSLQLHLGRALCSGSGDCLRGRALLEKGLRRLSESGAPLPELAAARRWAERRLAAQ